MIILLINAIKHGFILNSKLDTPFSASIQRQNEVPIEKSITPEQQTTNTLSYAGQDNQSNQMAYLPKGENLPPWQTIHLFNLESNLCPDLTSIGGENRKFSSGSYTIGKKKANANLALMPEQGFRFDSAKQISLDSACCGYWNSLTAAKFPDAFAGSGKRPYTSTSPKTAVARARLCNVITNANFRTHKVPDDIPIVQESAGGESQSVIRNHSKENYRLSDP
ncbi:unnamed protein product [Protopolystoma xenopodis]|uniref:Uncharacterized protein n=1 Tax=Protopolystoma xenopodis TaxID=117903 RepID=A0A448WL49_9PLAT|nr:unnamed protein product [Protopolystoma xenopodis]